MIFGDWSGLLYWVRYILKIVTDMHSFYILKSQMKTQFVYSSTGCASWLVMANMLNKQEGQICSNSLL